MPKTKQLRIRTENSLLIQLAHMSNFLFFFQICKLHKKLFFLLTRKAKQRKFKI